MARTRKWIRLINRELQWRYALSMAATNLILAVTFAGPAWYFIRQNYDLVTRIAYDTHPMLINALEREKTWIATLLVLGIVISAAVTLLTTLRVTTIILGPLSNMVGHMRKVVRGDWRNPEFRMRANDDMSDVTGTYTYLYRTLRAQSEAEIRLLEKIIVDPTQAESARAWLTLVNLKRKQLGLTEIEISEGFSSAQDSRRAS